MSQQPPRELFHGAAGYILCGLGIGLAIVISIFVLIAGLDPAILIVLWIFAGPFAIIFLARRLTTRSTRNPGSEKR